MEMTYAAVLQTCKEAGGYNQPELNDQLYLQCKGFCEIRNLDKFVNVKCLWLDQNAISDMDGVGALPRLVTLFLQNNVLRQISGPALGSLKYLRTLNLSHNYIGSLTGIAHAKGLESLNVSHNHIASLEDMEELWQLPELSSLDASYNKMERADADDDLNVANFFKKCPAMAVLYLHGQDLTHRLKNYRRNMVLHLPTLTYLDDRPIFDDERRTTEAWGRGGAEEERKEREKIRQEKADELTSRVQVMKEMYDKGAPMRAQRQREYEAKMDIEAQERARTKLRFQGLFTELDHDEYSGRAGVTNTEEEAWTVLTGPFHDESFAHARDATARRVLAQAAAVEELRLQREAEAELEAQAKRIAAEAAAEKAKQKEHFDEMRYWITRFEEDDATADAAMQRDFDVLLSELAPTVTTTAEHPATLKPADVHSRASSAEPPAPIPTVSPAAATTKRWWAGGAKPKYSS